MTASGERLLFKRAVYLSLSVHVAFLLFILISPHLPKPSRKGLIHYRIGWLNMYQRGKLYHWKKLSFHNLSGTV